MNKISIVGSGGSGKSTLARALAVKLNMPVYHLDALYWKAGWKETERNEWRRIQEELCNRDKWIMDGNYAGTLDIRLIHSDTIIFLDINRYLCVARALWRSLLSYGKTRPDMAEGCEERIDLRFIKWILDYPDKNKPELLMRLKARMPEKNVIILSSPRAVREFLRDVSGVSGGEAAR